MIADSGGPAALTDTEVLAPGSLNGFLSGKHYNRCNRLHELLCLAMEVLHFRSFMLSYEGKDELEELFRERSIDDSTDVLSDEVFIRGLSAYEAYSELTRSGCHGLTAQFWLMYVDIMRTLRMFERSIRTNDIDLFIYTLSSITALFFATGHSNYARYLSKYQLDLMNINETHPGLRSTLLDQGVFSVRRTKNDFSRVPVDLTLEQTVNADASSRKTGLSSVTNNYSARLKWCVTKFVRSSFVSKIKAYCRLEKTNESIRELNPCRIMRNKRDLDLILNNFVGTRNPFDSSLESESSQKRLFNLSTGRAASHVVAQSLLGVPSDGKKRHHQFVDQCVDNPKRFEESIPKPKLVTLASESTKATKTIANKTVELKCSRDLMGRLVVLATEQKLDLRVILNYPLMPVPFSMASPDGTILKTDKSSLRDHLESKTSQSHGTPSHDGPKNVTCCIIDAQFLLHVLPPNILGSYGDLARSILISAVSQGDSADIRLLFDQYPEAISLKSCERNRRGSIDVQFSITGPKQKRPSDLRRALASESFKRELPKFLVEEWKNNSYQNILGDRKLYVDIPGDCFLFEADGHEITRKRINNLCNNHLEADTKVCLHALHADQAVEEPKEILVRASDTDILVILVHHSARIKSHIWMDSGHSSSNSRRYIDINKIQKEIGQNMCSALPAFHAYSGSDFTSCFYMKGKKLPYEKLVKDPHAQEAFADLSTSTKVKVGTRKTLGRFTASVYGSRNPKVSLNEYRHEVFMKAYGPKVGHVNKLDKLRGMNASLLPPCEAELTTKLQRSSFVSRMWTNAHKTEINTCPTENDGFKIGEEGYEPIWHEGSMLPPELSVEASNIAGDDEEFPCGDSSSDESDAEDFA